jgi:hypothetical protein
VRRALLGALSCAALLAGGADAALARAAHYDALLLPAPGGAVVAAAALDDLPADDLLAVGAQGLTPGATYVFHLHARMAPGDPCDSPEPQRPDDGWVYSALVADDAGLAAGTATAPTFAVLPGWTYWVDIETPQGAVVACGRLLPRVV